MFTGTGDHAPPPFSLADTVANERKEAPGHRAIVTPTRKLGLLKGRDPSVVSNQGLLALRPRSDSAATFETDTEPAK